MKPAIRSILKGVEKVTDICSEILMYNTSKQPYSQRENHRNIKRWCTDLRRFTKKIKSANRKYLEEVLKLKENLNDTLVQEEVYDFFLDVTHSLVMFARKLTKSITPFLISVKQGRNFSMLGSRSQRNELLKSMKTFKTSIMEVMKTFFKIIDRTKELELCSLAAACKTTASSHLSSTSFVPYYGRLHPEINSQQILGRMHQINQPESN